MATPKAFVGRNVAIVCDQYDVSGNGNELKAKRDAAVIDATGFGDHFEYGLAGIQKSSIELKGHYAPGYNKIDGIINQRFGQDSDVLVGYAPLGWGASTALNPFVMQPSVITKYDIDAKLKGAVELDATWTARGAVDDGFLLQSPNTLITATGTGTILDDTANTGPTTGGAAAQLHVLAVSGTTPSLTMKIQSSPDGTTWTDLFTFTAATKATSQRMTLAIGNTVDQQIRANWTVSGTTPKFNVVLGFSRTVVFA